jgi:2-methylcitrate dehydratase
VDYPIGHRKRRAEGMPVLVRKFESSVSAQFEQRQAQAIIGLCADRPKLEAMRVDEFVATLVN